MKPAPKLPKSEAFPPILDDLLLQNACSRTLLNDLHLASSTTEISSCRLPSELLSIFKTGLCQ